MNHLFTSSRLLVFLTALALLLAACQPQTPAATQQPTDAPPQPAATATSVTPDDPNAIDRDILLDPALARDADSTRVNQYLYEGLVSLDASGNVQPAIAESWVISDDMLAYTFTLRPDAVFSDGSPITPDDIVANVTRWLDPESPLRGDGDYAAWKEIFEGFLGEKDADGRPLSPVDGVQKVELNTVILHLNRPVPELLTYLANPAFAILNPEVLEQGSYGTMTSKIISSGPYVVSSWTSDSLTLSPNPAYWGMVAQVEMEFTFR
jgi:ABC-type transport system substrate-binding protein